MLPRISASACLIALAFVASTAFAQQNTAPTSGPHGPDPAKFQEMKVKIADHLQKRIQALQQAQSCVQAATAPAQLKTCREQEHQAMEQLHARHEHAEHERGDDVKHDHKM